jgi:DNA-binding HxlR family transcriptional regulator
MKKSSKSGEPQCAVDYAFRRIGGKYKGRILWHLRSDVKRYGELRRLMSDITPKMLTQALRELEQDALISRFVYHEVPPRVEYQLTQSGKELLPFIELLSKWATKKMEDQNIPVMNNY